MHSMCAPRVTPARSMGWMCSGQTTPSAPGHPGHQTWQCVISSCGVSSRTMFTSHHYQRPDVLVQLGYIWRHVSAVNRPTSGQHRIIQGTYKLSEDFCKTIFSQILNRNTWCYYHLKEECLQFHSDLKCIRCAPHVWHGRCPGYTPIPAKPSQACLVWWRWPVSSAETCSCILCNIFYTYLYRGPRWHSG